MTPAWLPSFLRLTFITIAVYIIFKYLLGMFLPFLLAYILMRLLLPVMSFLHNRLKWNHIFSHYFVLLGFWSGILLSLSLLFGKILQQMRLLFSNFPIYGQILYHSLTRNAVRLCQCADHYFQLNSGTVYNFCTEQFIRLQKNSDAFLSKYAGKTLYQCLSSSFHFFAFWAIVVISTVILVKEIEPLHVALRRSSYYASIHRILNHLKKGGLTYLRTETVILFANCLICSAGLFLIKNPYFFLLGMAIAIFDAFPILGSGLILFPWSLYAFFAGNYYNAAILITTYLFTLFLREFLEAKIMGNEMGLNPFFMLAAIFAGIKLFGVSGIFLGPLAVVLIRSLYGEFAPA